MTRRSTGFSLLEILVALLVLSILVIPLYYLFSGQRKEVAWLSREARLHEHCVAVLRSEEALLALNGFHGASGKVTRNVTVGEASEVVSADETISISPSEVTSGLYRLDVELVWTDPRRGKPDRMALARLVVDREASPLTPAAKAGP